MNHMKLTNLLLCVLPYSPFGATVGSLGSSLGWLYKLDVNAVMPPPPPLRGDLGSGSRGGMGRDACEIIL